MPEIKKQKRPSGMVAFTIVWVGQFLSLLGSGMTRFAITLWAWELTGEATALALMGFFAFAPTIIMTPIAGVIIDRYNRKLMMLVGDIGAGLATIAMLTLSLAGQLEIWHVYAAAVLAGALGSFHFPAYSSATTMMIDKKHYARASAMTQLAGASSQILAPIATAALYSFIHLNGIMMIDVFTLCLAVTLVIFAHIPQPPPSAEGEASKGNFRSELLFGFRYVWQRPSLLGLQTVFLLGNLANNTAFVLLSPMILSRTNDNAITLASVSSAIGVGGIASALFIGVWGGPKRRAYGVLSGWILGGVCIMFLGLGRIPLVWIITAFIGAGFFVLVDTSNQALWQSKVPPELQGRVFSVRVLIAHIVSPISMLIAGPLADDILGPAMLADGSLAGVFGPLVGTGAGAGIALIFVFAGLFQALIAMIAGMIPAIRNVEKIIPDHQERLEEPFAAEVEIATEPHPATG